MLDAHPAPPALAHTPVTALPATATVEPTASHPEPRSTPAALLAAARALLPVLEAGRALDARSRDVWDHDDAIDALAEATARRPVLPGTAWTQPQRPVPSCAGERLRCGFEGIFGKRRSWG